MPFVLDYVTCGVGPNSSGNPDVDSSCWELVLQEEVRLLVRLRGGKGSWSSGVGARAWLEVGVK